MTRVSGPLRLVTDKPAQVAQVRVRAQHDRPEGGGLTTTFDDVVKTTNGQVDFTALPGPAIMLLETIGGFAHTVKLLIPDKATASLQECVEGAEALDVGDRDRLEKLAAEVMNATKAAREASASASAAKSSESSARSSASQAKTSASQAATSASAAKSSEQAAGTSAKDAATSERNAGASATAAKTDADRAANVANSTKWSGDRLVVNGKTSPPLTGPQGPPGAGNTTTVQTEAEAKALTGLPKGHKVYVLDSGTWYEEE